jgi:hypothetical protein
MGDGFESTRCKSDFSAVVSQPDGKKNWERKLFYLLTPALMGDPFTFTENAQSVNETMPRFAAI